MSDHNEVTLIPGGVGFHLIGTTVAGRYKVEALLGVGGMGSVYLVQHTRMRKHFALKLLNSEIAKVPEMVARFEREALAAAHIEHPNIAAATDFGKAEDGSFFLILEYLEGQRLRDALASGPMDVARAMHITSQIAGALERSHALGITHRDLKPENIMLISRQGDHNFVKVLDFGLAKAATVEPGSAAPAQMLSTYGTVFGTPKYMAPEQCVVGPLDGRADLYALGLILFEMLTGKHPFTGSNPLQLMSHQIATPTPRIRTVAPAVNVPAALEAVVMRLTEKDPAQRYANATELLAALANVVEDEALLPPPPWASAVSTPRQLLAQNDSVGAMNTAAVQGVSPPAAAKPFRTPSSEARTMASIDVQIEVEHRPTPAAPAAPAPAPPSRAGENPSIGVFPTQMGAPAVRPAPAAATPGQPAAPPRSEAPTPAALMPAELSTSPPTSHLPAPTRKVPLAVLLGVPAVLLGVVLFLVLRPGIPAAPVPPQTPQTPQTQTKEKPAVPSVPATPPRLAEQAQLDQANAQGPAGLQELAKQFPQDARIPRLLANSHSSQKNSIEALHWLGKAIALDAKSVSEAEVKKAAGLALSNAGSTEAAITLLENELGAVGVDVLYALALRPGQRGIRPRLNQNLGKPEVLAHASAAARIALELRAASECEAKRALLPRAATEGDARTLEQLKVLAQKRNCGAMGMEDCWPCLRKDQALQDALTAVAQRAPR